MAESQFDALPASVIDDEASSVLGVATEISAQSQLFEYSIALLNRATFLRFNNRPKGVDDNKAEIPEFSGKSLNLINTAEFTPCESSADKANFKWQVLKFE